MAQIGNIPEIVAVKNKLEELRHQGLLEQWALPGENLLTRVDAAIFFVSGRPGADIEQAWAPFRGNERFHVQPNSQRTLSDLDWQVQFDGPIGS